MQARSLSSFVADGDPSPEAEGQVIAPLPRVAIQVFSETPDVAAVIQAAGQDRRMQRAHLKVQAGGAAAAVEAYRNAPTPNVIVIETVSEPAGLLAHLDQLAGSCDEGTHVLVIGHVNDVKLYRELMRRGVSDYLISPISIVGFIGAVSGIFASPDSEAVGRTIAVVGAKGGVGASTVAHNVAFALSKKLSVETVLVDLDLAFGTAGLDFNQDPTQGVMDALADPDRVDANLLDRLLAQCAERLNLLAAPSTLDRTYDFEAESFDTITDVLRGSTPAVVLDVPHLWTGWSRRVTVGADQIVVVAEPDLANLRNAKNLLDVLRQARPNDRKPRLLLNKVGMPKRPEIATAEFAKSLETELIGAIPFDAQLFGTAANNGQMIAELQDRSKPAEIFTELANNLFGRSENKAERKSLLDPLLSRFVRKKA